MALMVLVPGDTVRMLPPFDIQFPDTYTVVSINVQTAVVNVPGYEEGTGAGFDFKYLVEVSP